MREVCSLIWLALVGAFRTPICPDFIYHRHNRLPRVALKRFPIQIELQSEAEAGASLSAQIRGRAQDIRAITAETYPGIIERVADPAKFRPQTLRTRVAPGH
jgi:2-methylcitrate dehydratase PrpD